MQWLAEICVKRPVFATMIVLAMVVIGGFSYFSLGVDRFPKIDLPIVSVVTTNIGASPEEIESEISNRIEGAVNSVSGIDTLSSTSVEGISTVIVQFDLSKDVDVGAQEVRDKVETVIRDLPESADKPVVQKMDPDASPVLFYAVTSSMDTRDLTELVRKQIKERLESINGVGAVSIYGGRQREIRILISPERLRAYNLSVASVAQAIASQNSELPGGNIDQGQNQVTVRTMGKVTDPEKFNEIAITNINGFPIRVRDIGYVSDTGEEPASAASVNGRPSVVVAVTKQSGTNTVAIVDAVKERMAEITPTLPQELEVRMVRDQSEFINASLHSIQEHLILGSIFAAIIVFLFLGSFRSTIIAALAIPTSIIAAFALMALLGYTLNQMTMLSLTLMVGIVIDDAIIVLENIFRFIEEKGMSPFQAAIEGTKDVGLAVFATTLSLLAVFVPVGFMSGIVGRFMSSFGLTSAAAIAVSLIVSFTLTPMLASRWISKKDIKHEEKEKIYDEEGNVVGEETKHSGWYKPVDLAYTKLLKLSLAHRWVILTISAVAFLSIVPLFMATGMDFLADDDELQFQIQVRAPEGTSLAATQSTLDRIAADIQVMPGVETAMVIAGFGSKQVVNNGSIFVRLVPVDDRAKSQTELIDEAREKLKAYPDELTLSVGAVPAIGGGGNNATLQYVIGGPDLAKLQEYSNQVLEKMRQDPNMTDVDSSLIQGKPEVRVIVDREKAADLGVSIAAVTQTLNTMLAGQDVTTFNSGIDQFDVVLRAQGDFRKDAATLRQFTVPTASGGTVTLDNVVKLEEASGLAAIDRLSRQRQVTFYANVPPGGSQSTAIASLERYITELNMGPGYTMQTAGQSKELNKAVSSFAIAIALSIIFMYMILAANFESFIHPITIMITLPLSLPFALFSTLISGQSLNIFALLGVLLLFGIVKKNAILQVDHTNHLRETGMSRYDAIIQANRDRLRPILMTTLALVAGMIPLILGSGPGSGTNRSIGILVVGGQTLCLLLTLLAVPVFYTVFDDFGESTFFKKVGTSVSRITTPIKESLSKLWGSITGRKPLAEGQSE